jgi:hypothetical protein
MEGNEHFEWHPPQAGVVCFPRLSPSAARTRRLVGTAITSNAEGGRPAWSAGGGAPPA